MSIHTVPFRFVNHLALFLAMFFASLGAYASTPFPQSETAEEVLLTFRYQGVGNVYVTGLYDNGTMYLPVTELFSLLDIHYETSPGDFSLSGTYLQPDKPFRIYFNQHQVVLGDQAFSYTSEAFRIGELDFYMTPRVFEEVFGLFFTVNMNALALSLETDKQMPVEERQEREMARQRMEAREVSRAYFPLEYDRNRRVMGLGFADYTLSANYTGREPTMNYTVTGGAEFLGGDLQGNLIGIFSNDKHTARTSNLRWRYVVRDNPWFSTFSAGQLSTAGLQSRPILGASISNNPIEPRRTYEAFVIDGTTEPDSEVELYLNNRLIDFRRADDAGYYRFEFPLTYGTSRLSITIYTPAGEVQTIDRQLQIPFTFLPTGEVSYNVQGGWAQTGLSEGITGPPVFHGDVALGVTRWLTAKIGAEHLEEETGQTPFIYGSLSARLLSEYLVNLDIAPEAFYRATASVIYPSSRNINLSYTQFTGPSFYNYRNAEEEITATVYTPFNLLGVNLGLRLGGEHTIFAGSSLTRYRGDLNFRLSRLNLRFTYRDLLYITGETRSTGQGQATASATYTFQRSPGLPVFVRGMFLRTNLNYDTFYKEIDRVDLQLSRSIGQTGRLILGGGYDVRNNQAFFQLGFTVDLNVVRSSTTVDYRSEVYAVRQSLRGSVGFDHNPERIVFENRDQVGRAGASVILFIDNNNSGTYDEGDEIIPHKAIRLDRSAKVNLGPDGILRISQLQSYYRYNLEVNRNVLPNPLLVPVKENFSFVTDPNRYKRIEIPFYRTGIIDGMVYFERNGELQPQGGLRLMLNGVNNDISETLRNFSDGGYYAMDLPPGEYTIEVDPAQLQFLNAYQPGGPLHFEIRPVVEGDFLENLDIIIAPVEADEAAGQETQESAEEQPETPVQEEEETPAEEQPATPVEEQPETPAEEQPATPVEEQPATQVEEQPATQVEEQPATPVEEQPETPVQEEAVEAPVEEPTASDPEEPTASDPEETTETVRQEPETVTDEESDPMAADAETTPVTHYIQVGLYPNYALADAARQQAEESGNQPHYIKRHRSTGLLLLFSHPASHEKTLALENALRAGGLQDVFVREVDDLPVDGSFHIQLFVFDDREEALDFISMHGPELGFDLILDHYESGNRFVLRTDSFDNIQKAMEAERTLIGNPDVQPVIIIRQ